MEVINSPRRHWLQKDVTVHAMIVETIGYEKNKELASRVGIVELIGIRGGFLRP